MNDSSANILKEHPRPAAGPVEAVRRFILPSGLDIARKLAPAFDVVPGHSVKIRRAYFDTHVWSLWAEGLVLLSEGGQLELWERDAEWPVSLVTHLAMAGDPPRFAWEFPESALRSRLERSVGFRALRRAATVRLHRQSWNLCDESGKTVARLAVDEIAESGQTGGTRFAELSPLRGYEGDFAMAGQFLEEAGADASAAEGPLGAGFRAAGTKPAPYSVKPALDFSPAQRARDVLREAAEKTLAIARLNEAGIIDDTDTEFLHDYRVCIRKMRSLLASIKEVFPDETLARWKNTLSSLGRATNRLRDLDVHLLSRENFLRLLPPAIQPGLPPLFSGLADQRAEAFRKVRAHFTHRSYLEAMKELETSLADSRKLPETENSATPIGQAAADRIAKRYRSIRKLARDLTAETPDHEIHSLRIECKKLRYLLEFFGNLFPEDLVSPLSRQLSRLQNRLGRFNDSSVQQAYLMDYWKNHEQCGDTQLAMALGGLITMMHHEHLEMREAIGKSLAGFCSSKFSARVKRLRESVAPSPVAGS